MSLIDPKAAAAARDRKLVGSPRALTATILWGLAGFAAATVIGFGIGGFFDQVRVVSINSVFSTWDGGIPVAVRSTALPVGIIGSIITMGVYSAWNHRYTGRRTYYAFLGPASIVLLGLATGVLLSLPMWAMPHAVGVAVDPVFHEDEAWGFGAWIMYAGIWWLPGIFIALGLTSIIGRLRAQRFRRRNTDLAAGLLTTGRLVDAEVTSSPQLSTEAMAASRAAVSLNFAFDDAQGARRWVTCLALLPPREVPTEGASRPLVFDPRTPSDVKRIFVSPTGDLEPSAFVAVRAA
ncbi:hypothetical protein DEU37_2261 [Microbacterium sp. AG790]|uniref:hypothetical protein n=1 Tax=Microbacterium sp. AG790 TaxID=2183995 RepID=UPI000EB573A1|nr:hypothetical protein [Microbacterium sp. AG790]RKS86607.1 hypothetical protein DEU37_2261 [Microbacterium sp. AG790]